MQPGRRSLRSFIHYQVVSVRRFALYVMLVLFIAVITSSGSDPDYPEKGEPK